MNISSVFTETTLAGTEYQAKAMFRRKSATQTKAMLEYLADAQLKQQLMGKHVIAQTAVVDEKNAALAATIYKLENLLKDALVRDAFIDLDSLKKLPRIPAFSRKKPERQSYFPKPPSSFSMLIPWKKKAYDKQYESAEAKYKKDRLGYNEALRAHHIQVAQEQLEIEEDNKDIEQYKQDFAAGKPTAIQNYFSLVLEKSAYPASFPKQSVVAYTSESETLRIDFALPAIDVIPVTKTYKYDKIRDKETQTAMPQKQRRLLYSLVLAQISLRTIHEVFTADRTNKIDSIVFGGYVDAINPSTGRPSRSCLVALNIIREQFDSLDLRQVEPLSCLKGLNARLSSKPDQVLAVPPMTQEDLQDATVSDAASIPYSKQQIGELEGTIQTQDIQIAELESQLEAQRARVAELVPDLRNKQARNAELQAEIQEQKDYIAKLESRIEAQKDTVAELEGRPTEALDGTQPTGTIAEMITDSDLDETRIFAPIASGTAEDVAGGVRIPPRESEQQTSGVVPKGPSLLEAMAVFVNAKGRYVDYIGERLPKKQIKRLVREGRLERHRFHTYKLRATLAGNKWYDEQFSLQSSPEPETASHSPEVSREAEKTITLGELLSGEVATSEDADTKQDTPARTDNKAAELLQRPAGTPDDLLTDLNELVTIMGEYGSETSRLIETMAKNNWGCNHDTLEAIFKQDENVTFANNIIDKINDRANEKVEHPLIIEENDQWIIDEEFRDEIEHILKHPKYLTNS